MSVTVKDVAREAKVSRTTVSNVFNGRAKYSEETRQAVLDAARRLGYKPNLAAKSLITNQSNLIGLILPSYVDRFTLTTSPFYNIILDGIYSILQNEPYYDLIIHSVTARGDITQVSDWIDTRNVDGILAVGEYDIRFLKELSGRAIPVVCIDNYQKSYPNFSYINSDDEAGGYLAARKLIERGFRKIAICSVSPLETSPLIRKRFEGYQRAMQEAGYPIYTLEGSGGNPFDAGRQAGERLYKEKFDAAFCTEDMLAIGVINFLLRQHVVVGENFGLVGFDNLNIGRQVHPALTSIEQKIVEKGEIATKTLLSLLKESTPLNTRLILPVELVERETA
jgi:LacI family transcriptional regulator